MAEVTFMTQSPIFRGKLDTNFRHSLVEDEFQDILSECDSLFKSLAGFQDFVISSTALRNLTEKFNNSLEDGNIDNITHNQSFQDENIVSIEVNQHDNNPLETDNPALNSQKSDAEPEKQRKRIKKNSDDDTGSVVQTCEELLFQLWSKVDSNNVNISGNFCGLCNYSTQIQQDWIKHLKKFDHHKKYSDVVEFSCKFCSLKLIIREDEKHFILNSELHIGLDNKVRRFKDMVKDWHSEVSDDVNDQEQIDSKNVAPDLENQEIYIETFLETLDTKTDYEIDEEIDETDGKPKITRKRTKKKLSKGPVSKNETEEFCENLQHQQKVALPYDDMAPSSVPLENVNLSITDDVRAISPAMEAYFQDENIADNCAHPLDYDKVDIFSATTETNDDIIVMDDENFDADDDTGSVQTCEELLFQMWSKVDLNNVNISGNFCGLCNYSTQIQQDWIKHLKKFDHHNKYSDVVEFSCEFCSLKLIIKEEEKHFILNSELHIGLDNKVRRFKDMDKDKHSAMSDDVNDQDQVDCKDVAPELDNQEINIESFLETLDTKSCCEIDEQIEETDSITLDKRFRTQCTRFKKGRLPEFGYCSYCLAFIFNRDEWIAHPSKHSIKNKTIKNNEGYTLKCPKMCCEIFCFEIETGKKYIKQHWNISHGSEQLRYDDCEQEKKGSIFLAKPDCAAEEYNGTKILTGFTNIWRHFYCLHCHNIIYGVKDWNEHMRSIKEKIQGHKLSCQNCQSEFFSLDINTGRNYVNFHLKTTHKVKILDAETPRNLMESTIENMKMHINFNPLIMDKKVFYYCTLCNLLLSHKKLNKFEKHTSLHELDLKGVRLKCSDCDSEIFSNDISIAQHHLQAHNKIHENEKFDNDKFISYLNTYWGTENWKIDKKSVCVECLTLVCETKFELHVATHTSKAIEILHCDFCYCSFFPFSSKSYYYLDLHISLCHHKNETTLPSNISKENIEIKQAFTPLTKFEKAYNFCTVCGLILCQTDERNRKFERHVEGHDSLKKGVCLNCKDCDSVIYSDDIVTAQHYLKAHAVVHTKELQPLKSTSEIMPLMSIAAAMEVKENQTVSNEEKLYISLTKFWSTNNWKTDRKSVCVECMTLVIEEQYESHVYLHTDRTSEFILGCDLCYCKFFSFSSRSYDYLDLHISFCHPEKNKTITASVEVDQSNPNPMDKQISSTFFPLTIHERLYYYCTICCLVFAPSNKQMYDKHVEDHKFKNGVRLKCSGCDSEIYSNDKSVARHHLKAHAVVHAKKSANENLIFEIPTEKPAAAKKVVPAPKTDVKLNETIPKILEKTINGKNFNISIQQKKVIYYCTVCGYLVPQFCKREFENHTAKHDLLNKGIHLKCNDCDSEIYSNDIITAKHYLKEHVEIHKVDLSSKKIPKAEHQIGIHPNFYPLTKNESIGHYCIYCNEHIKGGKQKSFDNHINKMHPLEKGVRLKCMFCYCWIFSYDIISAEHYLNAHSEVHNMNSLGLPFTENMDKPNFDAQVELEDASLCHLHKNESTLPSNISKDNIEIKQAFIPLTKFKKAYNFCTICGLILCQTDERNRKFERHVEGHDSLKKGVCLNCKDCNSVIYSDDIATAQHYLKAHAVVHIKEIQPLKSTSKITPLMSIATAVEVKENQTISKEENFYISLTEFWSTNSWKTDRKSVCVDCMTLVVEEQYESHVYFHTDRTFEFILRCDLCYCKFFSFSSRSYEYLDLHKSFCHPERNKTITASLGVDLSNPNPLNEIYSNDKSIARHDLKAHAVVRTKKSTNDNLIFETPTEIPATAKKVLPALKTDVKLKDSILKTLKKTKNGKNFYISIMQKEVIYYCTVCGFLVPQFCKRDFKNHTARHDLHIKGVHLNCNDCDSEIYSDDIITAEYYLKEHVEIHKVDLSSSKIPKTEHQIEIHPNFYPLTMNDSRGHYCMLCNEHIIGRKQKSFDNHINKMHPLEKGARLKCSDMVCNCWIFSNDTISAQHYLNAHGIVHNMNPLSLKFTENMDEAKFDAQAELEDATKTRIFNGFVTACEQSKNYIASGIYFCRQCNIFLTSKTNLENHIKRKHVEGLTCSCMYCKCEIYPNDDISFSYMEYHNDLCHSSIHKETKPSIVEINTNNGCNQAFLDVVEKKISRLVSSYHPNFDGVCLLCNLTFIDRFEWMDHLDTHIGAKEATCQKCCISCYGAEDDFKQCFEHPSHLDLDLKF